MQKKLIWTILAIGFLGRMIPHAWNYTPVLALAMFAGIHLDKRQAVVVPFGFMLITDIFLGFYPSIAYTWLAVIVCAFIGLLMKKQRSSKSFILTSLASSIAFFMISNFGVWVADYPHSLTGLTSCYMMAIPFFRNTLLSTLVYSFVLIGGYDWVVRTYFVPVKSACK